jgi:hypothetical protein
MRYNYASSIRRYAFCGLLMTASMSAHAQDISQIAQSDPLIITGVIGTNNTYYHSSIGDGYRSPLSNSFYVNLNISLYGISMPFSLYYSNDNLDFNYPHISFNLNPRYKNWTGYIGQSSMDYSSYVLSMSFNGVGVEYNDEKRWRFGAFYGVLRNAVNDDPNDPSARNPEYKRVGWGFKVGYGNGNNFIDLYVLRAWDKLKSLDDYWQQRVSPMENVAIALKGCARPFPWFSLTGNLAASMFSTDTRTDKVESATADKWSSVFDTRYSSLARFAGDVSATFTVNNLLNASVVYRMVQPDYTSLGAYYMSNNYHSFGLNLSGNPINDLSLTATFSAQSDNLTNKQLYTTKGYVYSLTASTRIGRHFNITAGYNGYTQKQSDGTAKVNDTTRVDRIMQSFSLTPSASFDNDAFSHSVSLSGSITDNKDRNKFSTGESDVTSKAIGLGYTLGVKAWEMDFMSNINYQVSDGYQTRYKSSVATIGTSRSFMKEKELNVGLNFSLCYNEVEKQSKSLSLGADLTASYTLKKAHAFSLTAGISKYGDVNQTKRRSSLDALDITASLNYTYTFSLLEIKRKAAKDAAAK